MSRGSSAGLDRLTSPGTGRLYQVAQQSQKTQAESTESTTDDMKEDLPHRGRPAKNLHLQSPHTLRRRSSGSVSPSKLTTTPKRRRRDQLAAVAVTAQQSQKIQAESFVMKLFDRSLDLSKYTEQTSLYPICRAWMANQPRNANIRSYRELRMPSPVQRDYNGRELLAKLRRKEIREINAMPRPDETELSKIATPLPPETNETSYDDAVEDNGAVFEEQEQQSGEQLLVKNMRKWKQVKTNWLQHTRRYQKRYEINQLIIQELFKP